MYGLKLLCVLLLWSAAVSVEISSSMPTVATDNYLGVCEVHNRIVEYKINGVLLETFNLPECVVSTAYVIRSTITTDPQDVAQFVEENRSCCCEITRFTRRQIRIGHTMHKYNQIETCACKPCDEVLQPSPDVVEVVE